MADQIPQETLDAVQATMANVEAAFRETNAQRTALSTLIAMGRATCTDIRSYNLQVKAVYAYQASVSGIIKANGGQAPSIPPPIYIAYRGVSGEQAANIDCNSAQMRGWQPNNLGDYLVNPAQVEWRQEIMPSDAMTVNQLVTAAGRAAAKPQAGLGTPAAALIPLIIYGIIVLIVAVTLIVIAEVLGDIFGKKQTTAQVALQAAEHRRTLEARAACLTACVDKGKDPTECAKGCDRLLPNFVAQYPGGGWGIVGTIAGVAVVGLAVYAGFRYVKAGGGGRRHFPRRDSGGGDGDGIDIEPGVTLLPRRAA